MCKDFGKRPSEMICWNDEEDWEQRLFFDLDVYTAYLKEKEKALKRQRRK